MKLPPPEHRRMIAEIDSFAIGMRLEFDQMPPKIQGQFIRMGNSLSIIRNRVLKNHYDGKRPVK